VYLDAREAVGDRFPNRFPTVFSTCRDYGIDPRRELMPVAPAAHYHMGGIAVSNGGRSSVRGLWACGEAAATAVHGANRLASNSLLEALVFGSRVAADIARPGTTGSGNNGAASVGEFDPGGAGAPLTGDISAAGMRHATGIGEVRRVMWDHVGLVRDSASLMRARALLEKSEIAAGPGDILLRNMIAVGQLVATAALAREESRGAHFRSDYPVSVRDWERRIFLAVADTGDQGEVEVVATEPAASLLELDAISA
jgi:L-aspartate oxidase